MNELLAIINKFSKRVKSLLLLFVIYLFILAGYATGYYLLYQHDPANFSFGSDILRKQVELYKDEAIKDLELNNRKLKQLELFLAFINTKPQLILERSNDLFSSDEYVIETADTKYSFHFQVQGGGVPAPPPPPTLYFLIKNINGEEIMRFRVPDNAWKRLPQSLAEFRAIGEILDQDIKHSVAEIRRRLDTLPTAAPDVWSFWDFFYFSTITQMTVGYGDILPNRLLIRMMVVSQLIIGSVLLVVVLNVVLMSPVHEGSSDKGKQQL